MKYMLILFLFFISNLVFSQYKEHTSIHFATPLKGLNFENDRYRAYQLIAHLPLSNLEFKYKWNITINLEPQIGYVDILDQKEAEYEFGVSANVKSVFHILNQVNFYLLVFIGPHYISWQNQNQANGFIFAEGFAIGFQKYFKNYGIDIQSRYRHMSNAGFKEPNKGIDTISVLIGVLI